MNKHYVLATNVVLYSPHSIFAFNEHPAVIPNHILQVCKGLAEEGRDTVLISRDTDLRVKAVILNLRAEDFRYDKEDTEYAHILCSTSLDPSHLKLIRSTDIDRHTALSCCDGDKIVHLKHRNRNPFGVSPRNIGQVFMQA